MRERDAMATIGQRLVSRNAPWRPHYTSGLQCQQHQAQGTLLKEILNRPTEIGKVFWKPTRQVMAIILALGGRGQPEGF